MSKLIENSEKNYENLSSMTKKLIETDKLIQSMIEKEEAVKNNNIEERKSNEIQANESLASVMRRKRSNEIIRPLHSKFTVLNQRASRFLKSLPSQASVSTIDLSVLEEYYNNLKSSRQIIKLPSIQKSQFYDPTPLPAEFKVNKDLMTVY